MGVEAHTGPFISIGQGQQFDFNEDAGPNAWFQGDMLADPRSPYQYQPGYRTPASTTQSRQYGWLSSCAIPILDQVPSTAATTNIVNAQAPTAGTALTVVSSSGAGITVNCSIQNAATGLTVTGLLGIDVNSATNTQAPIAFGQGGAGSGGMMAAWNPAFATGRCLIVTTNADDTGGFYTVNGYDIYNYPMTQKLTGVNNSTVSTTKAFKYIASVVPSGTINSTQVSVGTTDTIGIPLRADRFPYLSVWWGTPQGLIVGGSVSSQTTIEIPVRLPQLANTQVYQVDVPFDFKLVSANFRVTEAATTAAKAATLTAQANAVSVTGGVISLTSANCTPIGAQVAGTAITAGNTGTAGQTVGVVVSGVTAFIEGAGVIELVVQNQDDSGGTFVAAVTTSPATQVTGDVRGTFALPSASDGTKRLTIFWSPVAANMTTTAGLLGVTQV